MKALWFLPTKPSLLPRPYALPGLPAGLFVCCCGVARVAMFRFSSWTLQPYRSALPFKYSFSMVEKECTYVLNTDMATQDILPLINPISMKKASPPNGGSMGNVRLFPS
ncbi:hypothetical protein [Bilophila wadsworthia]|uniref:hypothetical protein n=1 Tax=Bilophila wadsworthia TaxID=35833 RepID=UPI003D6F9983